jgi:hypothetical protein
LQHLLQRFLKLIPTARAEYGAVVDLVELGPHIPQQRAIHAFFAEFVDDQMNSLWRKQPDKVFEECGLPRAQKAGNEIKLDHCGLQPGRLEHLVDGRRELLFAWGMMDENFSAPLI